MMEGYRPTQTSPAVTVHELVSPNSIIVRLEINDLELFTEKLLLLKEGKSVVFAKKGSRDVIVSMVSTKAEEIRRLKGA